MEQLPVKTKRKRAASHRTHQTAASSYRAPLNKLMHPRNVHCTTRPDFAVLAEHYPSFRPYVTSNRYGDATINFRDPNALRELTRTLLRHDYNLEWDQPIDQLCPTVTLRANYIHWLEDLLCKPTEGHWIHGVDIGTGASCIYPLLGARIAGWRFLATEIDPVALEWARRNVETNGLGDVIEIRQADVGNVLVGVVKEDETFDFCMCNPPFFATKEQTGQNPFKTTLATENELITTGGEVSFVERMIADSLILRERIRWYTSMIGKKSDLRVLKQQLRAANIETYRSTTFFQGRTLRWALAWTFTNDREEEAHASKRSRTDSQ